jgi:hypothetical protein
MPDQKKYIGKFNRKEYFDNLYKDVGGIEGLRQKRLDAGVDQNITLDMYPENVRKNTSLNKPMDYTKAILDDPELALKLYTENKPNADYHGRTMGNTIKLNQSDNDWMSKEASKAIRHHEIVHTIQNTSPQTMIDKIGQALGLLTDPNDPDPYGNAGKDLEGDVNPIDFVYKAIKRLPKQDKANWGNSRKETDAVISQSLRYYKDKTGKNIITENDAEEAWNWLYNDYQTNEIDGRASHPYSYLTNAIHGMTPKHYKKLAPRLVENKTDEPANSKILRDPNYA